MQDSSGSTAWAYDTKGNVSSRVQVTTGPGGGAGASLTLQQVFSGGRLRQQTYPSGRVVTYTYDGKNVASIAVDGVAVISNVKYQPFGAPVSWQMGATGTYSRAFNTLGQMTAYTFEGGQRTLVWDESNRITSMTNPDGTKWTYGYDNLDRVVTTTEGVQGTRAYTMDATGNRSSVTLNGALYSSAVESSSNRLNSATAPGGVSNYSYNGVGETLGDGARTYTWNNAGYLVQATGQAGAATYRYNGAGQRVTKILSNGGARHYFYGDDGMSLLGEYVQATAGAAASTVTEIVYLEGTPVLALKGATTYYIQTDHLNAPRLVKNSAGAASWRWRSDAYGVGVAEQNPNGAGVFELNARFPGQQFDSETGLYYNNARYYDPAAGRYTSSDPIGLAAGLNTYGYVESDPLSQVDPSGLEIAYANHLVLLNQYHSKIVITPENQAAYAKHKDFQNFNAKGQRFATLGAGPAGILQLTSGTNRPKDVTQPNNEYIVLSLPCEYANEDDAIKQLFLLSKNYNNNTKKYSILPFNLFGIPSGHNSNSFTAGLGAAAGFSMPDSEAIHANTPGYQFPLSRTRFGLKK